MTSTNAVRKSSPQLGIKPIGTILLGFFAIYLCVGVLLYLLTQSHSGLISTALNLDEQLVTPGVLYSGLMGVTGSWLLLGVTLAGLKSYIPGKSVRQLLSSYGFHQAPGIKVLVGAFLIGVLLSQILNLILIYFADSYDALVPNSNQKLNILPLWFKLVLAIGSFTITPLAEELMFRGVLYTSLAETWNRGAAVLASSIAFIALHPANLGSGNAITHAALVIITLSLAAARVMSNGLFVPVLLHAGFNFSANFLH